MRKTKIVCTLGPASSDYDTLKAMVQAGMDVVRLNFSHGDHLTHQNYIRTIRKVAAELKHPVAILARLTRAKNPCWGNGRGRRPHPRRENNHHDG